MLLIRMSSPPNASTASLQACRGPSGSPRSTATAITRPAPAAPTSTRAVARTSGRRAQMATSAPSAASASAQNLPIPSEDPVTSADRPPQFQVHGASFPPPDCAFAAPGRYTASR